LLRSRRNCFRSRSLPLRARENAPHGDERAASDWMVAVCSRRVRATSPGCCPSTGHQVDVVKRIRSPSMRRQHRDRRAQAPALANFTGLLRLRVPRRKLPHRRRFRPPARRRLGYLARPFGLACDKSIDLVDPQAPQVHAGAQENAEFTPALILDAASPNRPYPAKRANKWRSAGARPTQAARIRFSIDGA
jgi:hypothetical protein